MKAKLAAVAILFGIWAVLANAQGEDTKKDVEGLNGTWKLVSEIDRGQNMPVDPNEVFIFNGDNLVNKVGQKVTDEFTLKKVNAAKNPWEIDMIPLREPNKGMSCPAIMKVDGNQLTICVNFSPGAKRPTTFESTQANGNIILTMKK
jgi:uncharacterized protein (TIGR03067 family)